MDEDARTTRAERLASLAMRRAEPTAYRRSGLQLVAMFRRPLSRRAADLAVRELIHAAAHDRNALLRAAELVERRGEGSPVADAAHGLLLEAVAAITTR